MLLQEIVEYIRTQSTGFVRGTNLFRGFWHDVPDTATLVREYGGRPPQHTFGSTTPEWEAPRIQVLCRSKSYDTARDNAETIYRLLDNVSNQTLTPSTSATGTRYLKIDAQQSPFSLGRDDNDRAIIGCNYEVWKELST